MIFSPHNHNYSPHIHHIFTRYSPHIHISFTYSPHIHQNYSPPWSLTEAFLVFVGRPKGSCRHEPHEALSDGEAEQRLDRRAHLCGCRTGVAPIAWRKLDMGWATPRNGEKPQWLDGFYKVSIWLFVFFFKMFYMVFIWFLYVFISWKIRKVIWMRTSTPMAWKAP